MTEETTPIASPNSKPGVSVWLTAGAWGFGGFIYGWLMAGAIYRRDYQNLKFGDLGWADCAFALVCAAGVVVSFILVQQLSTKYEKLESENQLVRIGIAVVPTLTLVLAFAVLALTLTTYNADWKDARQGIATAFAALIAAVGVVVSVAVTYKIGEENRLAQKWIEQQKLDADLIKNLNDRLHEIIPRRYGKQAEEVSASYFQLAALYKDWETLSATSSLVHAQKGSQQRNILKLLFGVYQEPKTEANSQRPEVQEQDQSAEAVSRDSQKADTEARTRSELDILTLNSVIQDIFPRNLDGIKNSIMFDLSYLDLSYLDFSHIDLSGSIFVGAFIKSGKFKNSRLEGVFLTGSTLKGSVFENSYLNNAHLDGANLDGVDFKEVHLEGANLHKASMVETDFIWTYLKDAILFSETDKAISNLTRSQVEGNTQPETRVIEQLASCKSLPLYSELRKIVCFTDELVKQVLTSHSARNRKISQ